MIIQKYYSFEFFGKSEILIDYNIFTMSHYILYIMHFPKNFISFLDLYLLVYWIFYDDVLLLTIHINDLFLLKIQCMYLF